MNVRWYKHTHYHWAWDSRNECWYKYALKQEYRLQMKDTYGAWVDVPKVSLETEDSKPEV